MFERFFFTFSNQDSTGPKNFGHVGWLSSYTRVYKVYKGYIVFVFSVTMFVGVCVCVCLSVCKLFFFASKISQEQLSLGF